MHLIASYPKSGNTWVRALLECYFSKDQTVNLTALAGRAKLNSRTLLDDTMGINSADAPKDVLENLRSKYCEVLAATEPETKFVKVHDAYSYCPNGAALFPAPAVKGVVYLMRNPLNIAPSYADHQNGHLDETLDFMVDPNASLYTGNTFSFVQLDQRMGTWADHVKSWTEQTDLPVVINKYEDLCENPVAALSNILRALGETPDQDRVAKTVAACSLDNLRDQENRLGFPEKNPKAERFFVKGAARDWRSELTQEQAKRLLDVLGPVMAQHGYDVTGQG